MLESLAAARASLERVCADFDAGALDAVQAAALLRELGIVRRLVDGLLAKTGARAHETGAHLQSGERDPAHFYARSVGVGLAEARRAIDTGLKLEALPQTDAAVRAGRLSARQAQLIADTATAHPHAEADLLAVADRGAAVLRDVCLQVRAAAEDSTARTARQHAARSLRTWTNDDGMLEGHFRLTPEVGAQVKTVLDDGVMRTFRSRDRSRPPEPHDAYAADVLSDLVLGEGTTKGVAFTVHVVIDHAALVRGDTTGAERCEIPGVGPVSVAWVRDLLGDAFLTAVIKNGRDISTVAHLGRHVPAEVRTAMIVSGRECDVDGCEQRGYLERDHSEIDYAKGGPTAWWNLTWLCSVHHRRKTGGWHLGPRDAFTGKRPLRPPGTESTAA